MSLKNTGMLYLLVYLKRYKQNQEKLAPLYLRISYNGQRAEIALKRFVSPDSWDNKKQAVKGRNQDAHSINEQIRVFKRRIYDEYSKLLDKGEFISTHKIKEAVLGLNTASKSLLYAFDFHNKRMETQIGKSYSKGTLDRFITCKRLVVEFLEKNYKKSDISLQEIDSAFIAEFDYFLRTVRNCNNNTTVKYVTNLRKVVRMAIDFGWLQIDPFKSYKAKLEEVTKEILTETELEKLHSKQFSIKRLEYVRDVFLFCCYTGLAYADVKKLSKEHIYIGIDKNNWIQVNRTKTKV